MSEIFELLISYLNALWKRRWIVLLVAWVIAIPGWLAVAMIPDIYESSSRIYVDTSTILQPLLKGMTIQPNLGEQVRLMQQTLLSGPNLEAVIRKSSYDPTATTDAQMLSLVTSLKNRTSILANRENVFLISFEDTSAQRAHDVVQTLLNMFVEGNLGQNRQDLDTAQQFLDQQIADYEKRLEDSESKLAQFKQSHIEFALDSSGFLPSANAADNEAKKLEEDLKVAVAQRELLRKQLAGIPKTIPAALNGGGPPGDTEYQIVELQAKLRELLSQYTENYPDVVSTKRQLDALLAQQQQAQAAPQTPGPGAAASAATDPSATTEPPVGATPYGAPNPLYDQVTLRLMDMDAQVEDLRQRSAAARATAKALQSKAQEVPQMQAEFQKLDRDYNVVKSRYEELLARRESAHMSVDRNEVGQEVQYRVIDPPNVPLNPAGPNRPMLLGGVTAAAVAVGLGFALFLALLDTSISTLADLRQYTDLPVLGAITDAASGRNRTRSMAGYLTFGSGFAGLLLILAVLLLIERQVGLYNFAAAQLGGDLFDRVGHLFFEKAAQFFSWLKASLA